MTSFAFILGVAPLVWAEGAGAASRRSLGTAVFGGMLTSTILAVFFVPAFYVAIQNLVEWINGPTAPTGEPLPVADEVENYPAELEPPVNGRAAASRHEKAVAPVNGGPHGPAVVRWLSSIWRHPT